MVKVKICGLTRMEDIHIVNQYKPDYIGFVFAESKRKISIDNASRLKDILDKSIKSVGVFVNEPIANIVYLCNEGIIDMIQLHGDETIEYIMELKGWIKTPIIKAIRVQNKEQIIEQSSYPCDYLLLDTYVVGQYGGSGVTFDKNMIPSTITKPMFIAGGLNKENITKTIAGVMPYGVDISSGVETCGLKDASKIEEMIHVIRNSCKV